jgi:hypothetical protein
VTGPVTVATTGGISKGVDFTVTTGPVVAQTWYFAEGSTAPGFETFLLMENTTGVSATVNVIYCTAQYGRLPRPLPLTVPPKSRVSLNVNNDLGLPGITLDFGVELLSTQKIVCERSMYWNGHLEGTASIGATQTSRTWYFAEGSTLPPFETFLLIMNPSTSAEASVDITYMTPTQVFQKGTIPVGAGQRKTVNVAGDIGGQSEVSIRAVSTENIVCERAVYWNGYRGGHDSIGATQGSKKWYFAEGCTAWGFQTWLLLQNPNGSEATVDVKYMTPDGTVDEPTVTMPPNSRKTILANEKVLDSDTSIEVSSNRDIVAERAMYWDNGTGTAGHATVGMPATSDTIYLAEGCTAYGFETFVCIQNPNDQPATVDVTYITNDGEKPGRQRTIDPRSRVTIKVNDELADTDASIKLTTSSSTPIMAERALYWNGRGGGHCSIGWIPQ